MTLRGYVRGPKSRRVRVVHGTVTLSRLYTLVGPGRDPDGWKSQGRRRETSTGRHNVPVGHRRDLGGTFQGRLVWWREVQCRCSSRSSRGERKGPRPGTTVVVRNPVGGGSLPEDGRPGSGPSTADAGRPEVLPDTAKNPSARVSGRSSRTSSSNARTSRTPLSRSVEEIVDVGKSGRSTGSTGGPPRERPLHVTLHSRTTKGRRSSFGRPKIQRL